MAKYRFIEIKDNDLWDTFVEESPQGTIFSLSHYLEAMGRKYERFFICKGNEIKAALCYIKTNDGRACELDELVIYNGLMFKVEPTKKDIKGLLERFTITEIVIEELSQRLKKIELALAPQFEDLRPFLWHNYHLPTPENKFEIDLRYTSYIDISDLREVIDEEETLLFKNLDTLRQRNIREARKNGPITEIGDEVDLFIKFYSDLLESEGGQSFQEKTTRMSALVRSLLENDKAFMVFVRDPQGKINYIVITCFDSKRGYYLFGSGDIYSKCRYKGTIGFWDSFKILARDYGICQIDMEGVNSPKRGWFKLSFGGELKPYFQVYKNKVISP